MFVEANFCSNCKGMVPVHRLQNYVSNAETAVGGRNGGAGFAALFGHEPPLTQGVQFT